VEYTRVDGIRFVRICGVAMGNGSISCGPDIIIATAKVFEVGSEGDDVRISDRTIDDIVVGWVGVKQDFIGADEEAA